MAGIFEPVYRICAAFGMVWLEESEGMQVKDKNILKKTAFIIGAVFACLIIIQHRYVFMYFDDYGYASLSYGWSGNTAGMDYGLKDIFQFLKWHYLKHGGRVLYFFFEIVVFKIGGTALMQIVQAVIIIMISIISGKIVAAVIECGEWQSVSLCLVLYGTLCLRSVRDSAYWYTASVLYVWPLLPLLGCIWFTILIQRKETRLRKWIAVLLTFMAAFSQEQTSVLIIVWIAIHILSVYWEQRQKNEKIHIPDYLILMGISAVVGGAITILAPGNFVRAGEDEYYSKNIVIMLIENAGKIVNCNIGYWNWVFVLIMTVVFGAAAAIYLKNRKILGVACIFAGYYVLERILPGRMQTASLLFGVAVRFVWALYFFGILAVYYYKRKNYLLLSMLIAGICSQGALIVSPIVYTRCHTMMEFILHIILTECIISIGNSDIIRRKRTRTVGFHLCVGFLCIYALCNFGSIIAGYKRNDEINKMNHYKLEEIGESYKDGYDIEEVELYKLYDDRYATNMPYQEGYEYIEGWMKNYYELPQEIRFYWREMKE